MKGIKRIRESAGKKIFYAGINSSLAISGAIHKVIPEDIGNPDLITVGLLALNPLVWAGAMIGCPGVNK